MGALCTTNLEYMPYGQEIQSFGQFLLQIDSFL
jgi:hypothetical protein